MYGWICKHFTSLRIQLYIRVESKEGRYPRVHQHINPSKHIHKQEMKKKGEAWFQADDDFACPCMEAGKEGAYINGKKKERAVKTCFSTSLVEKG